MSNNDAFDKLDPVSKKNRMRRPYTVLSDLNFIKPLITIFPTLLVVAYSIWEAINHSSGEAFITPPFDSNSIRRSFWSTIVSDFYSTCLVHLEREYRALLTHLAIVTVIIPVNRIGNWIIRKVGWVSRVIFRAPANIFENPEGFNRPLEQNVYLELFDKLVNNNPASMTIDVEFTTLPNRTVGFFENLDKIFFQNLDYQVRNLTILKAVASIVGFVGLIVLFKKFFFWLKDYYRNPLIQGSSTSSPLNLDVAEQSNPPFWNLFEIYEAYFFNFLFFSVARLISTGFFQVYPYGNLFGCLFACSLFIKFILRQRAKAWNLFESSRLIELDAINLHSKSSNSLNEDKI